MVVRCLWRFFQYWKPPKRLSPLFYHHWHRFQSAYRSGLFEWYPGFHRYNIPPFSNDDFNAHSAQNPGLIELLHIRKLIPPLIRMCAAVSCRILHISVLNSRWHALREIDFPTLLKKRKRNWHKLGIVNFRPM
jgi:hypothetical protein